MAQPVIRAVIFDVGGVLVRTEDRTGRNRLEARLGLQPGESEEIVFNSEMGTAGQLGQITTEELWRWVQGRLGLDDEGLATFRREFWAGDQLDRELVEFVRRLKHSYQTAIISNALDNLNDWVAHCYPMADAFDLVVGSAYERVMKPDAAIFLRTLERLGRRPEESVFIDDFAHNVAGARALGMKAIHFSPATDLPAELRRLGVTPTV